jgi:hypothetical protein
MPRRVRHRKRDGARNGSRVINSTTTAGAKLPLEVYTSNLKQTMFERVHTYNLNGVTATTSDQFYALNFQLNGINASDLAAVQALFDMYRVMECTVSWIPQTNVASNTGAADIPILHSALDFDDQTLPTSQVQLQGYATYKRSFANRFFGRRYKPATLAIGSGSGSTSTGLITFPQFGKWIDIAFPAVVQLGTKWCFGASSAAASYSAGYFSVSATVEYRQSR